MRVKVKHLKQGMIRYSPTHVLADVLENKINISDANRFSMALVPITITILYFIAKHFVEKYAHH
jgi:hypothetical protein